MRSRWVLVLRLGVWVLGLEPKSASVRKCKRSQAFASVRTCSQAFASVRKRSQAFAVCPQASAAENRRETQNCRRFWSCVVCARVRSVNGLRDRGGPGCKTQNCRRF